MIPIFCEIYLLSGGGHYSLEAEYLSGSLGNSCIIHHCSFACSGILRGFWPAWAMRAPHHNYTPQHHVFVQLRRRIHRRTTPSSPPSPQWTTVAESSRGCSTFSSLSRLLGFLPSQSIGRWSFDGSLDALFSRRTPFFASYRCTISLSFPFERN
jgi:hypothetical protein